MGGEGEGAQLSPYEALKAVPPMSDSNRSIDVVSADFEWSPERFSADVRVDSIDWLIWCRFRVGTFRVFRFRVGT